MTESWHIPRALSDEALRLLTSLPMEEIERRLRMDGPAGHEGREPALRPIPVSERLPGPEDCAGAGDCWWYSSFMDDSAWIIGDVEYGKRHRFRYWLPAHALPLPEGE
ncbi:MAG: hypothetical protein KGN78_14015 [Actinomycetales bacterium]|nr:hypothetical protein [Actinomycetales bacterium]